MEIKKARERLRYHTRVLTGKVKAPKLSQIEKQSNVDLAQATLDLLLSPTPSIPTVLRKPEIHATREAWLDAFVAGSRQIFTDAGYMLPDNIKISIGFPSVSALSTRNQRLGECWKGNETHIFISPVIDDVLKIAGITTHELVHAVGFKKHNKAFKTCGELVGLEGKPAEMFSGPLWHALHSDLMESLGPLPHHRIDTSKPDKKKQTTRLLKCECPECGFVFRTTAKWIENKDTLRCPDEECGGIITLDGEPEDD